MNFCVILCISGGDGVRNTVANGAIASKRCLMCDDLVNFVGLLNTDFTEGCNVMTLGTIGAATLYFANQCVWADVADEFVK